MARLQDKVALISGGASGLGKSQALTMVREGAAVVVTDINVKDGEAVAKQINDGGGRALFFQHDVTDESRWEAVIDETVSAFGRLDIVVNNAGIGEGGNVEDTTLESWRRVTGINLDGVFLGTKHAIRAMKETGGGSIINISSIEGLIGDAGIAAYNASKGGVRIFTKSAALHCAKSGYNIRVNSVHPGYINTPMIEKAISGEHGGAVKDYLIGLHPIGRLGEPEDIANGVLYLASDESSFVTGSELVIDGGYTAQ